MKEKTKYKPLVQVVSDAERGVAQVERIRRILLKDCGYGWSGYSSAEIMSLCDDAARYRWLRDAEREGVYDSHSVDPLLNNGDLDRAIDAAIKR